MWVTDLYLDHWQNLVPGIIAANTEVSYECYECGSNKLKSAGKKELKLTTNICTSKFMAKVAIYTIKMTIVELLESSVVSAHQRNSYVGNVTYLQLLHESGSLLLGNSHWLVLQARCSHEPDIIVWAFNIWLARSLPGKQAKYLQYYWNLDAPRPVCTCSDYAWMEDSV